MAFGDRAARTARPLLGTAQPRLHNQCRGPCGPRHDTALGDSTPRAAQPLSDPGHATTVGDRVARAALWLWRTVRPGLGYHYRGPRAPGRAIAVGTTAVGPLSGNTRPGTRDCCWFGDRTAQAAQLPSWTARPGPRDRSQGRPVLGRATTVGDHAARVVQLLLRTAWPGSGDCAQGQCGLGCAPAFGDRTMAVG